jgi:hypothetical protein
MLQPCEAKVLERSAPRPLSSHISRTSRTYENEREVLEQKMKEVITGRIVSGGRVVRKIRMKREGEEGDER